MLYNCLLKRLERKRRIKHGSLEDMQYSGGPTADSRQVYKSQYCGDLISRCSLLKMDQSEAHNGSSHFVDGTK